MTAIPAHVNTAAAARSFAFLIKSLYSGDTKSHKFSMAEFSSSMEMTRPIRMITMYHSVLLISRTIPATKTKKAAKI